MNGRSGYQCVAGLDSCPGHPSKWQTCFDVVSGERDAPHVWAVSKPDGDLDALIDAVLQQWEIHDMHPTIWHRGEGLAENEPCAMCNRDGDDRLAARVVAATILRHSVEPPNVGLAVIRERNCRDLAVAVEATS